MIPLGISAILILGVGNLPWPNDDLELELDQVISEGEDEGYKSYIECSDCLAKYNFQMQKIS